MPRGERPLFSTLFHPGLSLFFFVRDSESNESTVNNLENGIRAFAIRLLGPKIFATPIPKGQDRAGNK